MVCGQQAIDGGRAGDVRRNTDVLIATHVKVDLRLDVSLLEFQLVVTHGYFHVTNFRKAFPEQDSAYGVLFAGGYVEQ